MSEKEDVLIVDLYKQNRLIKDEVYLGKIDEEKRCERKVRKKARSMEAASIILAHNHPGGILEPSEDVKVMTRELVSACQGVGIELEDHIIMTDKGYCSFKERELL